MTNTPNAAPDALKIVRDFIAAGDFSFNDQLPVERHLSVQLGLSRSKLRSALAALEAEGVIWRHVGRGTFIGPRPILDLEDVSYISSKTSPAEVFSVRLAIEPEIARLAALHGTSAEFEEMHRCKRLCRETRDWRTYEAWDLSFHLAIAKATHNNLLARIFDTVNSVRRAIEGKPTRPAHVPRDHASFAEHDAIYTAIVSRDPEQAALCMRAHLKSVQVRYM